MTLKEFVKAFMEANSINKDVDEMCKHISKEARKLAENGCAVLDEDQVEKIILGAKLEMPKKEEKKEGMVCTSKGPKIMDKDGNLSEPVRMEDVKKPHKVQKPGKKDDGQIDIFSLGVGLYD